MEMNRVHRLRRRHCFDAVRFPGASRDEGLRQQLTTAIEMYQCEIAKRVEMQRRLTETEETVRKQAALIEDLQRRMLRQ